MEGLREMREGLSCVFGDYCLSLATKSDDGDSTWAEGDVCLLRTR